MQPVHRATGQRRAVVLLVVISLLMLFAIVGIAFVIYAEAQASTARIWKESEGQRRPDMDPEELLSYFLSQLIFDTDNPNSALRGHSLARTMYGRPGSTAAFNGTGRVHTNANPANDDYYQVDYTNYTGTPRDPNQHGSPNAPYTYPDFNSMFLAAQRASDGAVLIPSYYRTNPTAGGPPITLRPDRQYHTSFPAMGDGGDVKNLADSPGFLLPGGQQIAPNDSIWIDIGHPVMTSADGRKFKPLFAPLVLDMDGRINLNAHGNLIGRWLGGENTRTYTISHQGSAHSEVGLDFILEWTGRNTNDKNPEVHDLFWGANGIPGRYDNAAWPIRIDSLFGQPGYFYSPTNQDCWPDNPSYENMRLPTTGSGTWAPLTEHAYSNGWPTGYDQGYTGLPFNFFDPTIVPYNNGGVRRNVNDRIFRMAELESILRYGDTGSPALDADLFRLCPRSFGDAVLGGKVRRLVTTHGFDLNVPGVTPMLTQPNASAAGSNFPSGPPVRFPGPGASPSSGEFGQDWGAWSNAQTGKKLLPRLDLNRCRYDNYYPDVPNGRGSWDVASALPQYQRALQDRQSLARDIYERLQIVVGPGEPGANAALAQLAVNIVDYMQTAAIGRHDCPSDVMTSLEYEPGRWVFGTVLPRLVISEVYAEAIDTNRLRKVNPNQNTRGVCFWIELVNTFKTRAGGGTPKVNHHHSVGHSEDATARFWVSNPGPGYAPYRILICDADGNEAEIGQPTNAMGQPKGIIKTIDRYTPGTVQEINLGDPANINNQGQPQNRPLRLSGDDLCKVRPANTASTPYKKTDPGSNTGFFVLGPEISLSGKEWFELPDANNNNQIAPPGTLYHTLPLRELNDPDGTAGKKYTFVLQRLACPYLPPQENPSGGQGYYNPYVTVDYLDQIEAVDGRRPGTERKSSGRNQPFAASLPNIILQTPSANPPAPKVNPSDPNLTEAEQPRHTFFEMNSQKADRATQLFAYDWLVFMNRPLLTPLELLSVSGYKPALLTQKFMAAPDPATGKPRAGGKFLHRAPWYDSDKRIYRFFEMFESYSRVAWSPMGGRDPGKINLNTVWDFEVFRALCDRHGTHFFTDAAVQAVWNDLRYQSRTKGENPGNGDRPFWSMAMPHAPVDDPQYPALAAGSRHFYDGQEGAGINDTFLRAAPDPAEFAKPPSQRRRLFEPRYVNPTNPNPAQLRRQAVPDNAQDPADPPHPFMAEELIQRIFANITTRSNVFAVWLTVGFFEVLDDSNPQLPPRLGQEIGLQEGRNIRHRMFAIVDRTNLTVARDAQGAPIMGPRPFFIESRSAVRGSGQAETVRVWTLTGKYEDSEFNIRPGDTLVVDSGANQETVQVIALSGTDGFTAVFQRPHPVGFAIGNAILGHPGPQPRLDARNPAYRGVIRHFSIIQ